MKKLLLTSLISLLLVSMVNASPANSQAERPNQAQDLDNLQPDVPQIPDKPNTAINKGLSGVLPDQANPTAKNVLNTIDKFSANAGQSLGNTLQSLLGNSN